MSLGQSPTDDALLDRIIGAPDDLAARLVYADLLTERGDPRGPFIALQCHVPLHATRLCREDRPLLNRLAP